MLVTIEGRDAPDAQVMSFPAGLAPIDRFGRGRFVVWRGRKSRASMIMIMRMETASREHNHCCSHIKRSSGGRDLLPAVTTGIPRARTTGAAASDGPDGPEECEGRGDRGRIAPLMSERAPSLQ